MAIGAARMGRASLPAEIDLDIGDEYRLNQKRREDSKRAQLDLAIAAAAEGDADIARKAAKVKADQEIGRQGVMKNYINQREQVGGINLGVVAPEYAPEYQNGPQVEKPDMRPNLAPVERRARIDLANINPDYSESFRTGMDTERETVAGRGRLANAETRAAEDQKREGLKFENDLTQQGWKNDYDTRGQAETRRHNSVAETLQRMGLIQKTAPKPADTAKANKLRQAASNAINEFSMTQGVLKRLSDHPGKTGLTGWSGAVKYDIPGGKTKDAEALRQQLVAKSAFAALNNMRQNSPTGGALGAVSDRENEMLQNSVAALQRGQSPEQFDENLKLYNEQLEASKKNIREAYKADYGEYPPDIEVTPIEVNTGLPNPNDPAYQRYMELKRRAGGN